MEKGEGLLLRLITPKGVVYEKSVVSVKINKTDGLMIIYKNYAPVLERLADGKIVITEDNKKVAFDLQGGWLTVTDNKCNIYSLVAHPI